MASLKTSLSLYYIVVHTGNSEQRCHGVLSLFLSIVRMEELKSHFLNNFQAIILNGLLFKGKLLNLSVKSNIGFETTLHSK